mmetsp:Transcript_7144/g.11212  ORF Transcript_7144/g.11212 Transcript_7144/m.11212 type:complete len:93 (+) Transcript_7144:845-1123(+)
MLRKLRLIATAVFGGMEQVAEGAEKDIFLRSRVPRALLLMDLMKALSGSSTSRAPPQLLQLILLRLLVATDNYTEAEFREVFKRQKLDVGPL